MDRFDDRKHRQHVRDAIREASIGVDPIRRVRVTVGNKSKVCSTPYEIQMFVGKRSHRHDARVSHERI